MKVVSVINYKGGVGKTTLTANIAAEMAFRGKRVLVIDLDPQTNLTFSLLRPSDWEQLAENRTIKALFDSLIEGEECDLDDLIVTPSRAAAKLSGKGKLHLISSHLGLINVDLELATLLGGASLKQSKQNFIKVHKSLAISLSNMDENQYDVVLVDCPPNFNIVTKTAIVACDYILVPTKPDYLSTMGIDYLIRNTQDLVEDYNDYASEKSGGEVEPISPAMIGVLFNMIEERNQKPISAQHAYIQQVKRHSGLHVFDSYVKHNNSLFASAPEDGVPVTLVGHRPGTHQNVVKSIEKVTAEFQKILGL